MRVESLKFLADRMLGKLAKYLLMLGFDTIYFREKDHAQLIKLAKKQGRVILSRDTKLLKVHNVPEHLFIINDLVEKQLRQVFDHFELQIDEAQLFTRCLTCNRALIRKTLEEVGPVVPPYILTIHQEFSSCPQCKRVYWRGTHQKRMEETVRKVFSSQDL